MSKTTPELNVTTVKPAVSPPAVKPAEGGMFESFRLYPGVRWVSAGALSTTTGHAMYQVTLGWLALQLTDSPFFVGLAGFVGGIPILIFGPPAGVVADRINRKVVLMAGQIGLLTAATLYAVLIAADSIERWSLLLLAFVSGVSMAFVFPAKHSILAQLVKQKDLANAVALNSAGQNSSRIFGPSLAGVLIAAVGMAATFAVAAFLQGLAFFTTTRLPSSKSNRDRSVRTSAVRDFVGGIIYVARDPVMAGTILLATIGTILIMPYIILLPVFVRDELGLGSTGLGFIMAGYGLGSVAGALLVAAMKNVVTTRGVQVIMIVAWAITVLLFAISPSVIPAAIMLLLSGVLSAIFLATNQTVLQIRSDDEYRGRVLGVIMVTWGMMPFGSLLLGILADLLGAPTAVAISCTAALFLVAVVAWRIPALR